MPGGGRKKALHHNSTWTLCMQTLISLSSTAWLSLIESFLLDLAPSFSTVSLWPEASLISHCCNYRITEVAVTTSANQSNSSHSLWYILCVISFLDMCLVHWFFVQQKRNISRKKRTSLEKKVVPCSNKKMHYKLHL